MCLDCFWFFSIISILNTQIQGEKLNNLFELSTKQLLNINDSSDERNRLFSLENKNDIEYKPRIVLLGNKRVKLSRVPSSFLKPPNVQRNDVYSGFNKFMMKKLKKNRVISTTPRDREEDERLRVLTSFYIRDHAPVKHSEKLEKSREKENNGDSEGRERISFHIHGHEGPHTYAFGYDTGNGNNRQFRYEERHENGTVTGNYGYYDASGKLRKYNYTSHPSFS